MNDARPPRAGWILRATEHLGLRLLENRGFVRRHVATGFGRMHLLEKRGSGQGPPLLFIHGLGSAGLDWAPLIRRLEGQTSRILVPDLPGHGWSEAPTEPELLEAVRQTLDPHVDEPVVVIGNSLGGFVGVQWALEQPEKVAGLVLLSPGGAPSDPVALQALMEDFDFSGPEEAARFMDRVLARPVESRLGRRLQAWGIRYRMQGEGPRLVRAHAAPERMLRPEHVRALPGPILLVWGQQDGVLPASDLDFWRAHLPEHAVIETPEHYGHSPYLEDPDGVAARIRSFLEAC